MTKASKPFDPATVKVPIWGLQDCDTPKSFAAFNIYRELGKDRKIDDVAKKVGTGWRSIYKWAQLCGWSERVRAYDEHLNSIQMAEAEQAFRMRVKEEARKSQELIFKAKRIVEHDLDVLVRRAEQNINTDSTVLDRGTLNKLFDKVIVLERLTTGASTETVDVKSNGPRVVKHIIVDQSTKVDKNGDPTDD